MKRLLLPLLSFSVAANAILFFKSSPDAPVPNSEGAPAPRITAPTAPTPAEAWSRIQDADLHAFAAKLEKEGLPSHLRRALITERVRELFASREAALKRRYKPRQFWQHPSYEPDTLERTTERAMLQLEKRRLIDQLAGMDEQVAERLASKYAFAAPEKRAQLEEIAQEMDARIGAFMESCQGRMLEREEAELKRLREEKTNRLKEHLSPEELASYQQQHSPEAELLRSRIQNFEPSGAEIDALLQYQKTTTALRQEASAGARFDASKWHERQAQLEQLDAQLKASLGEERYSQFTRAGDYEFRSLQSMLGRNDLPATTAHEVFDIRDMAMRESNAIYDDKTLSVEQKRAAMTALTSAARTQLESMIGAEMTEAYLSSPTNRWFTRISQGTAVKMSSHNTSYRSLPNPQ